MPLFQKMSLISPQFIKLGEKVLNLVGTHGFKKTFFAKLFKLPNNLEETYFIEKCKDSVQVLCITKAEVGNSPDVVLVQQFRPSHEQLQLELPGGSIEKGEKPIRAGIRELLEETSYEGDATYMGASPYSPYSTGLRHEVLVINAVRSGSQKLDPNEFVTVLKMPLREFREKIKTGEIRGWELGYKALDYLGKL